MNLDQRSFLSNDEIDAEVLGEDFANQMELMIQDDLARSRQVTPEEWTHRGLGTRVKEMAARLCERWL